MTKAKIDVRAFKIMNDAINQTMFYEYEGLSRTDIRLIVLLCLLASNDVTFSIAWKHLIECYGDPTASNGLRLRISRLVLAGYLVVVHGTNEWRARRIKTYRLTKKSLWLFNRFEELVEEGLDNRGGLKK